LTISKRKQNGIFLPMLLALSALALFVGWNYIAGLPDKQIGAAGDEPVVKEHLPDTLKQPVRLAFHDFEGGSLSDSNSHLAPSGHMGRQSFRMNPRVTFSPGLWVRFGELKPRPGSWLRAEAYVWFSCLADEAKCSLVATCNRSGINYKYMSVPVEKEKIKPNRWNRVSIEYKIPEPVGPEDVLQVYFWYRGQGEMLVDDIDIEIYSSK
jgi:hypothetical protein